MKPLEPIKQYKLKSLRGRRKDNYLTRFQLSIYSAPQEFFQLPRRGEKESREKGMPLEKSDAIFSTPTRAWKFRIGVSKRKKSFKRKRLQIQFGYKKSSFLSSHACLCKYSKDFAQKEKKLVTQTLWLLLEDFSKHTWKIFLYILGFGKKSDTKNRRHFLASQLKKPQNDDDDSDLCVQKKIVFSSSNLQVKYPIASI